MKNILAIIPARGGSKGLPRKNILPFCGKPLLAWTINAAASSCVTRCIVSSEDDEILTIAKQYGAETLRRPVALSQDSSTGGEVVEHILNKCLELGETFDVVLLLQPTSPLRTSDDIDVAYAMFLRHKLPCCVSVCKSKQSPFLFYAMAGEILNQVIPGEIKTQRQRRAETFTPNGALYFVDVTWFRENKRFIMDGMTCGYEMPLERSIDIDTELDFAIAEFLMSRNKI